MTVTATELRRLASLNLSSEQMAGVMDLLASRIEADDARKAAQAERKRRSRAKERTVTGQDSDESCDMSHKKEIPHTPLEKTTPHLQTNSARETKVSRGTRLPETFSPLPAIFQLGRNRGLTDADLTDELEKFRDWANAATGQVAIKRDWQAAFRNWIKRAADDRRKFQPRQSPGQALRDAIENTKAQLAGSGKVAGFGEPIAPEPQGFGGRMRGRSGIDDWPG